MSKIFGTNDRLVIDDTLDSDNELFTWIMLSNGHSSEAETWLTEDDAINIVEHLKQVFELSDQ